MTDRGSWRGNLMALLERQFRLRAKRSRLSTVWPVVAPFSLALLYSFIFKRVFEVAIPDYTIFLLCGLLPWTFLTQCLGKTILSITTELDLVRSLPFRIELLPLSTALSQAVNFLITLAVFLVYVGVTGTLHLGVLPAVVLPLLAVIVLAGSLSMIVALIDVYNRDLRIVIGNLLMIWFFLIPILYTQPMAPRRFSFLQSVDPMNLIIGQFRAVLYFGRIERPAHMAWMVILSTALFAVCLALFRRFSKHVAEDL